VSNIALECQQSLIYPCKIYRQVLLGEISKRNDLR
jgi:hypothetical protein